MRTVLWATLLSLVVGCGDSGGPASATATVALSVSPDPIQEVPCPAAHCGTLADQTEAAGTLRVRETGGVGLRLTSVALTLRANAAGTVIAAGQHDASAISQLAGTARVEANADLTVPVGVHYDVAAGGQAATLTLAVSGTDDHDHSLSQATTVLVTP